MTVAKPQNRVAILQSNYIPWKGYFDIIHDVDVFIFYDDVQFTKQDWRTRNRIKTSTGSKWLTIPAGENIDRLICEVRLEDSRWQRSHWDSLRQQYGKCPYFKAYENFLAEVYLGKQWTSLSELNQHVIRHVSSQILNITTSFRDSREFQLSGSKQERIIDLVVKSEASHYVSGPAAKDYLEPARFEELNIELIWKDYSGYPEYTQIHPPFEHHVSILDLLFQVGPEAERYIWGWRDAPVVP